MGRLLLTLLASVLVIPGSVFAHEVYVLDPASVAAGMATSSPNPFLAYFGNEYQFFFWGFVSAVVLSTIIAASIFGIFERTLDPLFFKLKRFALPLARVTIGLCFISFGIMGSLYGPEMPLQDLFGSFQNAAQIFLIALGAFLTLGAYTRLAALCAVLIYLYAAFVHGSYLLTYTDHLGGALLLLILGGGVWSVDQSIRDRPRALLAFSRLSRFAFPLMRILFGFGIMFAAVYAKYIHSQLALDVVIENDLTRYFPFDPLFVVLGALIIEFLAGLMLLLGIAVRWTSLFLLFWLTLSLLYFQEAVWPHLILIGLGLAIFCHGYDRYSLEGLLLKRRGREPLL
ncbi:MAG: hypothetical protein HYS26_02325 [Candidatus Kaiserbacteria bacterium]|nr:MAG: hypothetical protein HYS26_02325 [Candidatus Kaiserbacteria bacterium]